MTNHNFKTLPWTPILHVPECRYGVKDGTCTCHSWGSGHGLWLWFHLAAYKEGAPCLRWQLQWSQVRNLLHGELQHVEVDDAKLSQLVSFPYLLRMFKRTTDTCYKVFPRWCVTLMTYSNSLCWWEGASSETQERAETIHCTMASDLSATNVCFCSLRSTWSTCGTGSTWHNLQEGRGQWP